MKKISRDCNYGENMLFKVRTQIKYAEKSIRLDVNGSEFQILTFLWIECGKQKKDLGPIPEYYAVPNFILAL